MSTIRSDVAQFLVDLRKGQTFTTNDVYTNVSLYNSSEEKTARNRLAEFATLGLVKRIGRGTYKVTSSLTERKRWVS